MKITLKNKLLAIVLGLIAALCFVAMAATTTSAKAAGATNFKLAPNASIRLTEGSTGIRFTATMDTYDETATYGFVIVPAVYLDGITENYVPALEAKYDTLINLTSNVVESKDGGYEIKGSIANIKYNNIDLDFIGIAYEKDANGNYAYAEFESVDTVARSVYTVATRAYIDDLANDTFDEDDDLIIKGFMDKAVAKKSGITETDFNAGAVGTYKLAFESETLNANLGGATALKFSADTTADLNSVEFVYDATELTVDADKLTVTPLKAGELTLTAKVADQTATLIVNSSLFVPEGYIAAFDNDMYIDMLSLDGTHPAKSWTAEILENATDEQGITRPNVMKLTINLVGAPYWSFVTLKTPKAHAGTFTLEYFIPSGQFEWSGTGGQVGIKSAGSLATHNLQLDGVWTSWVVKGTASDLIGIGLVNHSSPKSSSLVIYVSAIYEGDQSAYVTEQVYKPGLDEKEIANFNLFGYKNFVKAHDTTYPPYNFKVEYLETYEGATGVIKLSGQVNSTGNQARLSIQLITPHTGTYTIKYRWGDYVHSDGTTTSLAAGRWVTGISDNRVSSTKTFELKGDRDVWNTSVVDTSSLESGTKYIAIQFWGSAVTLSDTSKENCGFVMYIDVIYDGTVA